MKYKILTTLLFCITLCSCAPEPTTKEVDRFEISKYNGYKVLYKCEYGAVVYRDWYVLRNDTVAIELRVPKWFGELYHIGDTIK